MDELPHPTLNRAPHVVPDFAVQLQAVPDDVEYLGQHAPFDAARLRNAYQPNPMRYFAPERRGPLDVFHHVAPFDVAERVRFQQSFDEGCFETVIKAAELMTQQRLEQKRALEALQRQKLQPVQVVGPAAYVRRQPTYEDANRRLLAEAALDRAQPRMQYVDEMPELQRAVAPGPAQAPASSVRALSGDSQVVADRARDLMMGLFREMGAEAAREARKSAREPAVAARAQGAPGVFHAAPGLYARQQDGAGLDIDLSTNQIAQPPPAYEEPLVVRQQPAGVQFQPVPAASGLFQPGPLPHAAYQAQVAATELINRAQPAQLQHPPPAYVEPAPVPQQAPPAAYPSAPGYAQAPAPAYAPVPVQAPVAIPVAPQPAPVAHQPVPVAPQPIPTASQSSIISSGVAASYQQPQVGFQPFVPVPAPAAAPLDASEIPAARPAPPPALATREEPDVEIDLADDFGAESGAHAPVTIEESPSPDTQPAPSYRPERPPSAIHTRPQDRAIEDILRELSDEEDDDDDFDVNLEVSPQPRTQRHRKKRVATGGPPVVTSEISDSFLNKIGRAAPGKTANTGIEDNDLFSD